MSRRKGTPCACECDPCRGKNYVRAVNNVSPDPNGDLELKAGNGIAISQSGDNEITITNDAIASSFVAGDNIEINPSGDDIEIRVADDVSIDNLTASQDVNVGGDLDVAGDADVTGDVTISGDTSISGTLNIAGDIIQQGAAYETHAEQIFTKDDYVIMRDGAVGGLAAGDYAGFQVKKYDGTNDGRLVIDKDGTARVGDVGDEQPLLTRDESASLTNGNLLQWNGTSHKAVDSGVNTSQIVRGSGNIGSDTKPVKVVNGVAVAVTDDLAKQSELPKITTGTTNSITLQPSSPSVLTVPLTGFSSAPAVSICPNGLPIGIDAMVWAITGVTASSFDVALFNTNTSTACTMSFYYTAIGY